MSVANLKQQDRDNDYLLNRALCICIAKKKNTHAFRN